DGIRDGHVTGVQTCALPISPQAAALVERGGLGRGTALRGDGGSGLRRGGGFTGERQQALGGGADDFQVLRRAFRGPGDQRGGARSEERRVGKECRCRRGRGQ